MDFRTYLATRLVGVGSILGVLVMASVVTFGAVRAQNAATTASRASLSGVQSVITQTRDSVQRRTRAVKLWAQRHQPRATKPDAPDRITK